PDPNRFSGPRRIRPADEPPHHSPSQEQPMTNILFLTSSPRGGASHSSRVAARVLEELRRVHPRAGVTVRDLAKDPVAHIDEDFVTGIFVPSDRLNEEQRERLAQSDALIDELLAADIVVIAV